MPWCPNCKTEYREGVKKCADCGSVLVAELKAEDDTSRLCLIRDEQVTEKLLSYLEYSGIKATSEFSDDDQAYIVKVGNKDIKKAKVEYGAFLTVEASAAKEAAAKAEDDSLKVELVGEDEETGELRKVIRIDSLEDLKKLQENGIDEQVVRQKAEEMAAAAYKPAGVYQSQSDKANELSSTGFTFLIIGIAMLIFTLLNFFKVITLFEGRYPTLCVLTAISIAACLVGIGSFKRSKSASSQIEAEEKLTSDINDWMEKHINIMTEGELSGEDGTGEEELYLKRTAVMKSALKGIFGNIDDDYADSLIDDFYNKHF